MLVPTRELAIQVGDVIAPLARTRRLRHTLLYGGRSLGPERQAAAGGAQIVIGTPGRTLDHLRQGNLTLRGCRILVLDEGDEMLDRGFAPDVERILAFAPASARRRSSRRRCRDWVAKIAATHLRDAGHDRGRPRRASAARDRARRLRRRSGDQARARCARCWIAAATAP